MPTNYTGDPVATQAPSPTPGDAVEPVLQLPNDGEAANVASIYQEFKCLADFVAYLTNHAAWRDLATTISNVWTFQHGTEATAPIVSAEPTTRRYFTKLHLTGTAAFASIYHAADLEIVSNAVWDPSGPTWSATDAALKSTRLRFTQTGFLYLDYVAAGSAPWADGAWTTARLAFDIAAGTLTTASGITAGGAVVTSAGNVEAAAAVVAGTGLTVTTGNATVSTGNITATLGDITASDGNIIAAGTPTSDAGPGLVKAKRFYSTGDTLVAGDVTAIDGFGGATGDGDGVTSILGTDSGARIAIRCNTAGGAAANPATFTLTFADGTFTTAPAVVAGLADTDDAAARGGASGVRWTVSPTTLTVTFDYTPLNGQTYTFGFIAIGR